MSSRPRVLLAVDRRGWAFDHIAQVLVRLLGEEYDFTVACYPEIVTATERYPGPWDGCVAFWWGASEMLRRSIQPRKHVVCVYDGYTWHRDRATSELLAHVCAGADVLVAANNEFARALGAVIPSRRWYVCEDAVDTTLFIPQPLPREFTAGWVGNSCGAAQVGHGNDGMQRGPADLKGFGIVREACELAGVKLIVQDLETHGLLPHEQMPSWYAQVSVVLCASTSEGGPNPILEAMACGRPVVSTAVGLVPGLVHNGCGRVVRRTTTAFARALSELRMVSYDRLTAAGYEARRMVLKHDRAAKIGQWRRVLEAACRATHAAP